MATGEASGPFALHNFFPCVQQRSSRISFKASFSSQERVDGFRKLYSQTNPSPIDSSTEDGLQAEPGTSVENPCPVITASRNVEFVAMPNKNISRRIAVTSTAAAVGFTCQRILDFGVSLGNLIASAVPYEQIPRHKYYKQLLAFHEIEISAPVGPSNTL